MVSEMVDAHLYSCDERERKEGRGREGRRERGRNQSYLSNLSIIIELILLAEDID